MEESSKEKNNTIYCITDDMLINERSLKNQYRHIVDATNIVSKTDIHGVITYANSKFVEISGYSEEELIGKHHNILRNPDIDASFFKELWETIKSKQIWNGVITNVHKNGSKYTVEASIFPILDAKGDVVEYIAIRHDITRLQELNDEINALHSYDMQQQHIAREKLEMGIVNDFDDKECKVLYAPSDIISGDFYSLYRGKDGSRFLYIIDGQGHGVSPALTVFAVSSTMNQLIKQASDLQELTDQLFPTIKSFLGEIEQLSYIMIKICPDSKKLSYVSAGMYPFLIKEKGMKIKEVKANNIPFMNFSEPPKVSNMDIEDAESILLYSDGLVEHEHSELNMFSPQNMILEPLLIDSAKSTMSAMKLEDDVTLLYLKI
ncbi:putative sensor protein containing PAS/PAC and protein phosphatase 2C domain [Sulfurimonas gotlandica GD1]|jgi:PAS domain S-box-containing protein|uniref:Putative sensor protein containing PAS/PAC and protein phosphatase 2C domain n=1 Tax=Sulfurimonas gotlandica (strain DSM 19862 / JCM 16533 / GD1) TaxID=929558 RepID=B6BH61_SULGG|nr:SpoIIE family protein phosphatase [Sulfurimonas gotlandica]EDZ63128.1 aerotaxis sensor receptor, senses cellular redox state [Sulfurimonas gotlandica GD1]EHP29850.1 putative sensor protein containing PAS/PAC and protein phosphatase 2C domain [Sulfurimonas gotlandica GD1]